jgi:Flp pilus assembly protein TadD
MRNLGIGAIVVLYMASCAHAGCVGPEALESKLRAHPDAKIFTEIGKWFDEHQQYSCAIPSYRAALKFRPESPGILGLLAASLYSSGDVNSSADALQSAITLAPKDLSTHLRLAAILEELHKRDAKIEWQRALEIDPRSEVALDGLSRHLIAEGDYAGAIALLRDSRLDEKLTLDLVQAYGKAGMLKKAEELLTTTLAKGSSYPLVNALATVYVNEGVRQKALEVANEFSIAHPDDADANTLRLRLLLLSNDISQAAPLAQKLLASRPRDPYLLYVCGTLERQAGDFEAARGHLQLAVNLDPEVYQSHYGLGIVLLKLNDLPGAKEHLERALSFKPPDPEVHMELATVLRKLGETVAAEHELKLYREASQSTENATVAESKAILAQQELDSGDPGKAVELYRQALEATPGDALLNYKFSVALGKVGDITAERDALEKAVQIDPDMAAAHNQLGYLASRGGDMASAEKHFREAIRAAPTFVDAWINLAAALGTESKLAEAGKAVETALQLDPNNSEAQQLQQELAKAVRH